MTQALNKALPLASGKRSAKEGGATYPLKNRIYRALWIITWRLAASWTPSILHPWRRLLLRAFGASMAPNSIVHGSARIWFPPNLIMGERASMGPNVICYNLAPITLAERAIISQGAHLCTGTHNIDDPDFPLVTKPISIGAHAWIAAEAFVGPGVSIGEGTVLAARSVAVRDLEDWTVYAGNPAVPRRRRIAHH